jgi:hypothetical protein
MAATTENPGGNGLAAFLVPAMADEEAELPVRSSFARIGQGPQNDIVLDDDSVSTSHAQIEYRSDGWFLTDLESKNGTYVNGNRLVPGVATAVPDGAMVAFGALKLRFRHGEVAPSAADTGRSSREAAPRRRSTGFRLPVWLALVILLVIAAIVFVVVTMTGGPAVPEPSANPAAALPSIDEFLVAVSSLGNQESGIA